MNVEVRGNPEYEKIDEEDQDILSRLQTPLTNWKQFWYKTGAFLLFGAAMVGISYLYKPALFSLTNDLIPSILNQNTT